MNKACQDGCSVIAQSNVHSAHFATLMAYEYVWVLQLKKVKLLIYLLTICRERVCVFLCIILHAVSEIEAEGLVNAFSEDFITSLASITVPIRSGIYQIIFLLVFFSTCWCGVSLITVA